MPLKILKKNFLGDLAFCMNKLHIETDRQAGRQAGRQAQTDGQSESVHKQTRNQPKTPTTF